MRRHPRRPRHGIRALSAVVAVVLPLAACSGDDADDEEPTAEDESGPESGTDDGEESAADDEDDVVHPAEDGTTPPEPPDLSQEVATTVNALETWDLTVNDVRQAGDEVTVWATLTNLQDERDSFPNLVDRSLPLDEQVVRYDMSGVQLIDWNAGRAYYPMATDAACSCSQVTDRIGPGESATVFVMYNGVEAELDNASLAAPHFVPADGLSGS